MGVWDRIATRGLLNSLPPPHQGSIIYQQAGSLRAVQIPLGYTKIESTVRYLGVDVEDALARAEKTEA
jgi:hypothetical protein